MFLYRKVDRTRERSALAACIFYRHYDYQFYLFIYSTRQESWQIAGSVIGALALDGTTPENVTRQRPVTRLRPRPRRANPNRSVANATR